MAVYIFCFRSLFKSYTAAASVLRASLTVACWKHTDGACIHVLPVECWGATCVKFAARRSRRVLTWNLISWVTRMWERSLATCVTRHLSVRVIWPNTNWCTVVSCTVLHCSRARYVGRGVWVGVVLKFIPGFIQNSGHTSATIAAGHLNGKTRWIVTDDYTPESDRINVIYATNHSFTLFLLHIIDIPTLGRSHTSATYARSRLLSHLHWNITWKLTWVRKHINVAYAIKRLSTPPICAHTCMCTRVKNGTNVRCVARPLSSLKIWKSTFANFTRRHCDVASIVFF